MDSFKLRIVYDNKCYNSGFLPGFGFSALIYNQFSNKFLLFDTGGNGNILYHNLQQFRIEISNIEYIVISHNHGDHTGGLNSIYQINPNIKIYVPINYIKPFKSAFPRANVFGISKTTELDKNIYSSGQIDSFSLSEQALFLKTEEKNLIILVGCAHPGLEHFILKAKLLGDIIAVIGGFHSFKQFSYLNDIDFIGACHCTQYVNDIQRLYPLKFRKVCVGDTFNF